MSGPDFRGEILRERGVRAEPPRNSQSQYSR